ncbi:probable NAD(P)H dehydrogenase (quinone) FQR1-like 1 [Neltuma alba]|uniref:probable NAD(P)H dehydrogenase (quinone) FQR1-like 1 n=1 Tax=Neltuma alba TaxID=207710 RepID=UPI0010A47031|nr:probable NAD(P)H dehydrogenase (quinone) FQR1-like 1 [Prosopis alba]
MGKGGGCVPSKKKAPISGSKKNDPVSESIETQSRVTETTTIAVREAPIEAETKKLRVFIVYYSMYGHVESLAREIKKGVDSVEGVEGVLYRVAETLPKEVLEMMKAPPKDDSVPVTTAEKLVEADGVIFGFPTRFGSMAAQMKAFFDSTGQLWREQKLAGKPAGFFVSTGTQGGGQETTAWTAITQLAHHGMIYVPVGYTLGAGMFEMESVRGGSPYGAGVFAGDGTRQATDKELALAEHQGKHMATTVKKLSLTS